MRKKVDTEIDIDIDININIDIDRFVGFWSMFCMLGIAEWAFSGHEAYEA